ncbi:MAG: hypothetical protein ABGW82_09300, partial [Paracoccus sp. (in: a-proteobacteria)]
MAPLPNINGKFTLFSQRRTIQGHGINRPGQIIASDNVKRSNDMPTGTNGNDTLLGTAASEYFNGLGGN